MSRTRRVLTALAALAALATPVVAARGANGHANFHAVCPGPPGGSARCHVVVATDERGNPDAGLSPTGLSPAAIKAAYGFPTDPGAGAGETIAIVDAYDAPTAEADLNTFSSQFGLPPCTTANGCFQKVNQNGGTSYPSVNAGWALEIALDVQWAHAIAPGAKILLVEASSNSFANLLAAESYAKTHAGYVSNSWGASEFSLESLYDSYFKQSGVSVFVSAGDSGLPAEYPSSSPNVISVGGTTLHFDGAGNLTGETGWSDGGGGCSAYESATAAQAGFSGYAQVACGGRRATPDVALDADPASGVSVYDSTPYSGQSGWFTVGGTSASAPMWAGRAAVEGVVVDSAYVYGSSIPFRDVTSGSNGAPCLTGFDLCSGRGSWASASPPPSASLTFATAPQTLTAGQPSGPVQVALANAPAADVDVTVASSSAAGSFATSPGGPWSAPLHVTIQAGHTTSPAFYYEDTRAGAATLTASASGLTAATQAETVGAAGLAAVAVSPASASVAVGGSQTFSAAGSDAYGNAVAVPSFSWAATGSVGSVAPASGASTTFTAGATPGGGSVTATAGGVTGSASVTVTALTAPASLTASAQGRRRIVLSWQGSGAGVTYNVYRGLTSGGEGTTPYATGVTGTSFSDTHVTSRRRYYYVVRAVSGTALSDPSNEASATAR